MAAVAVFAGFAGYAMFAPATYEATSQLQLVPAPGQRLTLETSQPAAMLLRRAAVETEGLALVAKTLKLGAGPEAEAAAKWLMDSRFDVKETRDGDTFALSCRASNAEDAKRTCDALAGFMASRAPNLLARTADEGHASDAARSKSAAELAAFLTAHPEVMHATPAEIAAAPKDNADADVAALKAERDRIQATLARMRATATVSDNPFGEGDTNAETLQLRRRLAQIERRLSDRHGAERPEAPVAPEVDAEWKRLLQLVAHPPPAPATPTFGVKVERATLPGSPIDPDRRALFSFGTVGALLAAAGTVLLRGRKRRAGEPDATHLSDAFMAAGMSTTPPPVGISSNPPPVRTSSSRPPDGSTTTRMDQPRRPSSDAPIVPKAIVSISSDGHTSSNPPAARTSSDPAPGGASGPEAAVSTSSNPPGRSSSNPPAARTSSNPPVARTNARTGTASSSPPVAPGSSDSTTASLSATATPLGGSKQVPRGTQDATPLPMAEPSAVPAGTAQLAEHAEPGKAPSPGRSAIPAPVTLQFGSVNPSATPFSAADKTAVAPTQAVAPATGSVLDVSFRDQRGDSPAANGAPTGLTGTLVLEAGHMAAAVAPPSSAPRTDPLYAAPVHLEAGQPRRAAQRTTQMLGSPIQPVRRTTSVPPADEPKRTASLTPGRGGGSPPPPPNETGYSYVSSAPTKGPYDTPPYYVGSQGLESKAMLGEVAYPHQSRRPPAPAGGATAPTIQKHQARAGWRPDPALAFESRRHLCDQLFPFGVEGCFVLGVSALEEAVAQKALVASEIALALAEPRHPRVLLLEADFQWPRVHELMHIDVPMGAGFSQQLRGRGQPDAGWTVVECIPALHVLAEGVMRAPGLILSVQFEESIRSFRRYYDFIVIHGPPVSAEVDLRAFANVIDGIVMVAPRAASAEQARVRPPFADKRFSHVLSV